MPPLQDCSFLYSTQLNIVPHLIGSAIVIFTSLCGSFLPVLLRNTANLRFKQVLKVLDYFGLGIIFSTAFQSSCVKINTGYKKLSPLVFLLSILSIHLIECLLYNVSRTNTNLGVQGLQNRKNKEVANLEKLGKLGKLGKKLNKNSTSSTANKSGETAEKKNSRIKTHFKSNIQNYVLELGIIMHSVVVGFSLGLSESKRKIFTLSTALAFHQFFEGISVGDRLFLMSCNPTNFDSNNPNDSNGSNNQSNLNYPIFENSHSQPDSFKRNNNNTGTSRGISGNRKSSKRISKFVILGSLIYSISTPFGQLLAIAIKHKSSNLVSLGLDRVFLVIGILEAICAGLLFYSSLTGFQMDNLLAMLEHNPQNKLPPQQILYTLLKKISTAAKRTDVCNVCVAGNQYKAELDSMARSGSINLFRMATLQRLMVEFRDHLKSNDLQRKAFRKQQLDLYTDSCMIFC
ncbi:hypothetical protein BB560_004651 [Smittium megazygosporum]|uniref:Zinc/iron permease n=1 Tax=Smittium megazygosporum TaxID=133381 RepID=A0A2T9Z8M2_9FUNG|nr:hypothetical protein BB560_004651 [Smittium megazygosporum]